MEDTAALCRRLIDLEPSAVYYLQTFAVVNLVCGTAADEPFTVESVPEALRFDARRLEILRRAVRHLVAASTFVTRAVQTAQSIVRGFEDALVQPLTLQDFKAVERKRKGVFKARIDFFFQVY